VELDLKKLIKENWRRACMEIAIFVFFLFLVVLLLGPRIKG